jgi:hypothetical protein
MLTTIARPRWLPRSAQLALVLAVDAGFLYAWSAALGGWIDPANPRPTLGLTLVIGILVLATLAARLWSVRFATARFAGLTVAFLGLVIAILIALVASWAGAGTRDWSIAWRVLGQTSLGLRVTSEVGLALVAWWRGIAAGRTRLVLEDVEGGLRGAVLALAGVFLLNALAPPGSQAVESTLTGATAIVLFAGLTGLPLARVFDMSERPHHQEGPPLGVRGHWLTILLGTIAVLLLITALLAQVFTFERIDDLTRPLAGPANAVFWTLFYVIVVPLGFVVEGLIYLIRLFLHPGSPTPPPQPPNFDFAKALRAQSQGGAGPPDALLVAARWTVGLVLAAIVVWLLTRALFRFAEWGTNDGVEESRDFVWSWSTLREWLQRLVRSLRGWKPPPLVAVVHRASVPRVGDVGLLGPRELYRELLRLGALRGRPRARDETPREYERALEGVNPFDAGRAETEILTDVYGRARYGNVAPDEATVAEARAALDRLRALDELNQQVDAPADREPR